MTVEWKDTKMTRSDAIGLLTLFGWFDGWDERFPGQFLHDKFQHAMIRISREPRMEAIGKEWGDMLKKLTGYKRYEKAVTSVKKELAAKDKDGKPISIRGDYVPENRTETEIAILELAESPEWKEIVEERDRYMNEEVEVGMYLIDRKYVPKRNLSLSQKRLLDYFVVGEFEEDLPEPAKEATPKSEDKKPKEAEKEPEKKAATG